MIQVDALMREVNEDARRSTKMLGIVLLMAFSACACPALAALAYLLIR